MGAESQSVGHENKRIPVHHPLRRDIDIPAAGDIVDAVPASGGHDTDVAVRVAAVCNQSQGKPFAVRGPVILELPVMLASVGDLPHLSGPEVKDLEYIAVFQERELLAVRRE